MPVFITDANRTPAIDSKLSLDGAGLFGDLAPMPNYPFHLYCQRVDAARNMARYYAISIQPTLFGEASVVRSWGRIGKPGGEKTEIFGSEREAAIHFLELARRKKIKGYKPVGSCGNPAEPSAFAAARR